MVGEPIVWAMKASSPVEGSEVLEDVFIAVWVARLRKLEVQGSDWKCLRVCAGTA